MTLGKPRDARKEQQWRRWIENWRASGLSVRAFCARYGLAQPSFDAWRRELQRRNAERPVVVPVHVVAEDEPACDSGVVIVLWGAGRCGSLPALMRRPSGSCWPCGRRKGMLNFPPSVRLWLGTAPVD